MIKQYVNLGLKRLLNLKIYSFINIGGFGIALAVCMAILLYSFYHFSFDKHIENGENSYRIISRVGDGAFRANTFASFDDVLEKSAQVQQYTVAYRIHHINELYISDKEVACNEAIFVEPSFFDYFSVKMIEGNTEAIDEPNTVFVTPEMAQKLFPGQDAIGKMVQVNSFTANRDSLITFTVRGIVEPLPDCSHLGYEILFSQKGHFQPTVDILKNRKVFATAVYLKLFPGIDPTIFTDEIVESIKPLLKGIHGPPADDFNHRLQAVHDIHFSTNTINEMRPAIRKNILYVLLTVGILIFIIAASNFGILFIARASYQQRQMKIIEFLGGNRWHTLSNAFVETLVSVIISFLFAIVLLSTFRLSMTSYFNLEWVVDFSSSSFWIIAGLLFCLVIAFKLVFFLPLLHRKKEYLLKSKLAVPLMIFQFFLVISLVAFTIVINKQMDFIEQKDLGYDSKDLMVIEIYENNPKVYTLRDELKNIPGVTQAACVNHYPGYRFQDMNFSNDENSFSFKFGFADQYAIPTLNVKMLDYFTGAEQNATNGWYINKHFYEELKSKYSEEQIASGTFSSSENNDDPSRIDFNIVGVMNDFNYLSLHSPIDNFAFFIPETCSRNFRHVLVELLNPSDQNVIMAIEGQLNKIYPSQSFDYHFLESEIQGKYASEKILMRLINSFSFLTILVACLGLIGLSLLIIEKKTKEIAVRKVNGSTTIEIVRMLNRQFIFWIAIAFIFAIPTAYYFINLWLKNFAYKTSVDWWVFALAGLIAMGFTLMTISWQSWKAARRNPSISLRYE